MMIKKIPSNVYIQLISGLIVGVIGVRIFYLGAIFYYIRYSGFSLFDIGASGDKSPITLVIAIFFAILTLIFPLLICLLLYKFGKLKSLSKVIKIITFILFATLPVWIFFSMMD